MSDATHKENLDLYKYATDAWEENAKQGDEDMRYVSGDPWDPEDRKAREEAKRPCLCFDELGPIVNQRINDVRQNKRGVKLSPKGNGASDKTAELRSDIIRTIESKGGTYAYTIGYENALQRGMGGWAVSKRYIAWDSRDQELYIRCIPNARAMIIDPDAKEAAAADMRYAFLVDTMPLEAFKKKFKGASTTDFSPEMTANASQWFSGKNGSIQLAECWRTEPKPVTIYWVGDRDDPKKIYSDDLPEGYELSNGGITLQGQTLPIVADRKSERINVVQYIMNGVENLEKTDWEGRWIPIIPVFGKQYWLQDAGGSKRVVESLIRKARDGQLLHNYIKTAEHESIGRVLKATHMAWDVTVEKYQKEWALANKVPLPFLRLDATKTGPNGQMLEMPRPMANMEMANIQGYEIADEGIKRSIQNAMGSYSSSTVKADAAGKSGKAQLVQEAQADQGNFHFTDSLDQSIEHTGRILDEMIPHVYDTQRELLLRHPDDTAESVTINSGAYVNKKGETVEYRTDVGDYDVTVSTGPSFQSQREMAEKTADLLLESQIFAPRIADLAIKLKNLGPMGDAIAERLTPPEFADKEENGAQQAQQKLQKLTQAFQVMTQQLEQMTAERDGKKLELESREKIAAMQADVDKLRIQADLLKTHEQLTSKETIAATENDIKAQFAELQARIDMMSAEHGAEIQQRQAQMMPEQTGQQV